METLSIVGKETLEDIAYSLDRLKGTVEYWRKLIPLLPKECYRYNKVDVEKIALVGTKGSSPSLKLLQEFQRKGMDLSHFKNMLQTIECQGALDCFKQPTKPVIFEQPKSVTIFVNEKLELRCAAKCIPEPPDYQWFYYGATSVPLKDAKSWRLIIDKVTMHHNGYYCCRVHNRRRLKDVDYAVFSQYAMVTVKGNKHADTGSTHSFTPVQEVSGQLHETSHSQLPASDPPSCEMVTDGVNNIQMKDPIESTDTVDYLRLIKIVIHPTSQTVKLRRAEETVTLQCHAESLGGQELVYRWYYLKGNEKPSNIDMKSRAVKGTGPSIDIVVESTIKKLKRRYFCSVAVVDQPEYRVASKEAVITLQHVWFVEQPKEKYVVVTSSEVTLSCKVETAPAITVEYEWFTCQQDGTGKQPVDCFRNEMTLPAIIRSQGYYVCDVTSKSSDMVISRITSDVAHVEVVNSTEITVKPDDEPPKERYVEFKDKLVLEFKASCKHYPVKYQWYYNGKELPNATTSTLIVPSVAEHNVGSYYCEASSDYSAQPVMSGICRVQWKGPYTSLPTRNRQQIDAEEQMQISKEFHATDKMALLIGNCSYKKRPLECPKNDVEAVTAKLRQLNFKTISLVDLTLSQIANAVDYFCSLLDKEMYAVFYFSGHGVDHKKTTYLMPIDADDPVRLEQCVDCDNVAEKMQKTLSKVIMIFDCCRVSVRDQVSQMSSVQSTADLSGGFSNICQVYACTPSLETYESKGGLYSYMTQALLQAIDTPISILKVITLTQKHHNNYKQTPKIGKSFPTIQVLYQMKVLDDISLHDPILNESKSRTNELLLVLPETRCLEFTNPKLKNMCGQVELRFSAKFSNVLIVHVVCDPALQPEVIEVGLKTELECDIQNEDDKIITSFRICNLLDVVQDKTSKLQILFQMPQDSSAKETLEYKFPTEMIKPAFYHH